MASPVLFISGPSSLFTPGNLLKENNVVVGILRNNKDSIPINEENTDYQAYLKWVAEGNTVLPADEGTQ